MHYEFGSASAVCSIEESSGPQNSWVPIVLRPVQWSKEIEIIHSQ